MFNCPGWISGQKRQMHCPVCSQRPLQLSCFLACISQYLAMGIFLCPQHVRLIMKKTMSSSKCNTSSCITITVTVILNAFDSFHFDSHNSPQTQPTVLHVMKVKLHNRPQNYTGNKHKTKQLRVSIGRLNWQNGSRLTSR